MSIIETSLPGGGKVPVYATFASFPASAATGDLGVAADTGNLYEWNGAAWQQIGGPGSALSLGALDAQAATATGSALVAGVLSEQSADATHPGLVNTAAQTFGGQKTLANPIVGTQVTTDNSTKAASTAYVTTAIANAIAGVNPAVAVQAATTAASDTSGFTYNNGVAGIGAFFTGSVNTAVTIDGYTFTALGQRLLVKNDTQAPSGAFNGVYYVTQVQTAILAPILTRALDFDAPSDINNTGAIPVINGTVNSTTQWVVTSTVNTVGTDPITFAKFSRNPADYLLVANNLSDVASKPTSFNNISPLTAAGDVIYEALGVAGNTRLPVGTANQLMSVSSSLIPSWLAIPLSISLGGMGATNKITGFNNLTPMTTAGDLEYYSLVAGGATRLPVGTANQLMSVSSSLIPAWLAIPLSVSLGGMGATNVVTGFNNLSPLTTTGDIIYEGLGATGNTRLPIGGTGAFLFVGSSLIPTWGAPPIGVTAGGTGGSSFLAFAVLCAGISGQAAFQAIASTGSSGQVLTSNGAALPSYQAVAGSITYTAWATYLPTTNGFGTISATDMWWRRLGDTLEIYGQFANGTNTAVEARIGLPTTLVTDPAKIASIKPNGQWTTASVSSIAYGNTLVESGATYVTLGFRDSSTASNTKQNGSALMPNGTTVYVYGIRVPITGWT